jgi:VWFA-related protein
MTRARPIRRPGVGGKPWVAGKLGGAVALGVAVALATPLEITAAALPQFRVSVDVVRIEALVLDRGRPVGGLSAADLAVTDNGVPQTITVRPLARQPIDVAIALDISSSVRGAQLERLRQAARTLVGLLTPEDRATLVTFHHQLTLGPREAAAHALDDRLAAIAAGGQTALVDAVTAALVWGGGRERPMLILAFSDGRDTASWTRGDQALALARTSDAVVDAVVTGELLPTNAARTAFIGAVGLPAALTPNERFLADLAAQTGGRVRNGDSGAGLAGAFRESLEQFRGRYEITYTATGREPGWHAVNVRVPGRRGATVHARRGYQR